MKATSIFSIGGMTCGSCSVSIENSVSAVAGVETIAVSLITERASVVHDIDVISADTIKET